MLSRYGREKRVTRHTQIKGRERERICWKCGRTFRDGREECPDDGARLLDLSPDDLDDPLIGQLFDGRFRIIRKLGEGGMGNVYAARQMDFEREVALKLLKADYLRNENIRKRFMYEARTISNLSHPNALRLFDFGQAPNAFYMVMELLDGESLADRLAYRFLTYREIFHVVPPICGVLGEAHRNDVVHRDLKPENIFLVDVHGRSEFPKLLDFGIAKHLTDETMTQSGTLWGTPAYMSPEQAKGEAVAAAADVYAIGIMLYELICGNLPFHSSTQMGLAMKHISVPARPLLSIPGLLSVPDELDSLILKMLSKDPSERPADMLEVADALIAIEKEFFDDALLDSVPAEEVDAIALQDWIAAQPAVDEDVSLGSLGAEFAAASSGAFAAADANQGRSPITSRMPSSPDVSSEIRAVTAGRPWVLPLIVGVLLLAGVGGVTIWTWVSEEPAQTVASEADDVELVPEVNPTSEAATAAAGRAAALIFFAQDTARKMQPESQFIIVDSPEELDRDGKFRVPAPSKPARKESSKGTEDSEVKSALEKTF